MDDVVKDALSFTDDALIVIKSTVPVGHTRSLQERFGTPNVIFSPEFLREGNALIDNLYPSRIIMGCSSELGAGFASLLVNAAKKVTRGDSSVKPNYKRRINAENSPIRLSLNG